MNKKTNIQQVYEILDQAGWSWPAISGHFQGLLNAIERDPERAEYIINVSVDIAKQLVEQPNHASTTRD